MTATHTPPPARDLALVRPYHEREDAPATGYMIFCPACGCGHLFNTLPGGNGVGGQKPVWLFNGDHERPTFSPSMMVHSVAADGTPSVCHSFVHAGEIAFCGDSTHELAGQTVPLEPF